MRTPILRLIPAVILWLVAFSAATQAQSDAGKIYKTNCVVCHSADGSGSSPAGKALHSKDLRSEEVQKQSDAALAEAITKGKGKMPAFGAKVQPDDVTRLVAYIREMAKKK